MAVPKRRTTRARRDKRRANHNKISPVNLVLCPNCQDVMVPHRVCPSCGHYNGRLIFTIKKSSET